jgi:hypothetical protein
MYVMLNRHTGYEVREEKLRTRENFDWRVFDASCVS